MGSVDGVVWGRAVGCLPRVWGGRQGGRALGFKDAWLGVLEADWLPLAVGACRGILPRGGTILGTSRIQPYQYDDGVDLVKVAAERHQLDGFLVVGGNGSLSCARDLGRDGVNCIRVPKTSDNDHGRTERPVLRHN